MIRWLERRKERKLAIAAYYDLSRTIRATYKQLNYMLIQKKSITVIEAEPSEDLTDLYNEFLSGQEREHLGKILSIDDKQFTTNGVKYFLQIEYTGLVIDESAYSLEQFEEIQATFKELDMEQEMLKRKLLLDYNYDVDFETKKKKYTAVHESKGDIGLPR